VNGAGAVEIFNEVLRFEGYHSFFISGHERPK
jgi:hypothetical protein